MQRASTEAGTARETLEPPVEGGGRDAGVRACEREEDEIRRALGVESTFGYHVEERGAHHVHAVDALPAPDPPGRGAPRADERSAPYPCLDGYSYSGCLGAACSLETCWTGGATVSFARRKREESRVSTALYLPGAPCHDCAHLAEDEIAVPAPRALGQPGATRAALRLAHAGREVPGGAGTPAPTPDETARLRRVTCGRGLWAHPISLSSFLMKRIPMLDQAEPAQCPGYAARPEPHPEVAAHLRRRRDLARRQREERRAVAQEGL